MTPGVGAKWDTGFPTIRNLNKIKLESFGKFYQSLILISREFLHFRSILCCPTSREEEREKWIAKQNNSLESKSFETLKISGRTVEDKPLDKTRGIGDSNIKRNIESFRLFLKVFKRIDTRMRWIFLIPPRNVILSSKRCETR